MESLTGDPRLKNRNHSKLLKKSPACPVYFSGFLYFHFLAGVGFRLFVQLRRLCRQLVQMLDQSPDILSGGGHEELFGRASETPQAQSSHVDPRVQFAEQALHLVSLPL